MMHLLLLEKKHSGFEIYWLIFLANPNFQLSSTLTIRLQFEYRNFLRCTRIQNTFNCALIGFATKYHSELSLYNT